MKKKLLACLLALSVVCNSGSVVWAFGSADEEVEMFDSGETAGEVNAQEETKGYEETVAEDDVEVFQKNEQPEAEPVPLDNEVAEEDVFGNDVEEPAAVFSDAEPVFGDSVQLQADVASAGTLEVGKSVTLTGDADGNADFTFKVDEEGIYKLKFSEWMDMRFPEGIELSYGNNSCATKLTEGSYVVQCSEVAEGVTVTAEKLPDIVSIEVVSISPDTFYKGEDVFANVNAKIKITKSNGGVEEVLERNTSSYGGYITSYYDYAGKMEVSFYFAWEPNIKGVWNTFTFKDLSEDNPKKIDIGSEEVPISSNAGRYYFQFTPSQKGEYKISCRVDENYNVGYGVSLFKVTQSGDEIIWNRVDSYYEPGSIVADLDAHMRYIVRVDASSLGVDIPVKVESIVGVQSFELADGQKLPTEIVDDFTKISSDTKFKIQYTDTTSEEIFFNQTSVHHGRIKWIDKDGYRLYCLTQDSQNEQDGHFVKGPKVTDFENATGMTELSLGQMERLPCSEIYLDGAYFKFQAKEKGTYKFHIKNAGRIQTSWGSSYGTSGDYTIQRSLASGEYVYFAAGEMFADAIEVTVNKIPTIKSITLKQGKLDGETFIRGILEDWGEGNAFKDCVFEVEYSDGTPSESISIYEGGKSKYYGYLNISGFRDDNWELSVGERKISVGFSDVDIRSPEYTVYIVEQPSAAIAIQLTIGQEQTLRKGPQDMQWFSFQAPETGTYHFDIKAGGEDITQDGRYFLAKESAKAKTAQGLTWEEVWRLSSFKLQKGETLYVGIAGQDTAVTAKVVNVPDITKVELADGEVLPDNYIYEFLVAENYLPQKFKITFSDKKVIVASMWDFIEKLGVSYGQLQCEWPTIDNGNYVSGKLKVYVGNTFSEVTGYSKDITVKKAVDVSDLTQLKQDAPISSTSSVNYNNAYCFVYEPEKQGVYEITFTPKENNDDNWNRFWLLKDGKVTDSGASGGSSFVRELEANEKIYFMYKGQECSVDVKTGTSIKSFSVTPKYQDILYGHFCEFNNWEFQLTLSDETKSEKQYSGYSSFDRYGRIDYKLDNGQNFEDGADIGETNVQFYLSDFKDIRSDKIPITVKKGSEMNFTKLELNKEAKVEEISTYANYHSATFIPEEDGLYEYKVKSWFNVDLIDDDGINHWINSNADNIYEGVIEGRAGKGYTFLVDWLDGAEIGEQTILITKIDKSKLQTLYNANKDKSSSGYTTYSWNAFVHALEGAEAVLENESALQREIDKAHENLKTAIKGLTYIYYPPSVDKTSLRQLYNTCSGYKEADYTAQSWKAFQEAMTTAKSALDNSYSQSTVDDAKKKLKVAADGLVKAADKKSLQEAYGKYKSYNKADYTEMTWTPFEKALSDAAKGIEDKDLTTEKAAELLNALEKAAAGLKKVGVPTIKAVNISGNKATVQLSGKADKAEGYDFVIGTDKNCIRTKNYDGARKNITTLKTDFKYVQKGTYYAYCHAWKKVDGKKVFGSWSQPFKFTVTAATPAAPKIKSVSVKGNTVTVVFDKIKNITSYDVVLGKKTGNDSIYGKRPVNYGNLVKKSKGNTIVFKNVKKGTYYLGAHAANRTGKGGKKIFGKWSGAKKIVVK